MDKSTLCGVAFGILQKGAFGMTEENMRKTIAGNIAKYRKQLGMTQIDLSEKINYSDKSISKWERGVSHS